MSECETMDRQSVISGLRHCSTDTPTSCKGCPYNSESYECIKNLVRDALELIEDGEGREG